jgi:hypothetical protein
VRNAPVTVQNVVTYDAVVEVPNPELKLKPGMTANVTFLIAERRNVLKVPNAALRFQPAGAEQQAVNQNGSEPRGGDQMQGMQDRLTHALALNSEQQARVREILQTVRAGDEVGREPHTPMAPDGLRGGGSTEAVKTPLTAAAAKPATERRDGVMPNRRPPDDQDSDVGQLRRILTGEAVKTPLTAAAAKPVTERRDGVMPNRRPPDDQDPDVGQLRRILARNKVEREPHTPMAPDRQQAMALRQQEPSEEGRRTRMQQLREQTHAQIRNILTEEQRQKYAELLKDTDWQRTAVTTDRRPGRVWMLNGDGQLQPTALTLGIADDTFTEVVSGDLHAGQEVITGLLAAASRFRAALPGFGSRRF